VKSEETVIARIIKYSREIGWYLAAKSSLEVSKQLVKRVYISTAGIEDTQREIEQRINELKTQINNDISS